MKYGTMLLILIFNALTGFTQIIPVDRLFDMLNWGDRRIDTTLKREGYLLMQKDVDSSSSLYQYSMVQVEADAPVVIRSLMYMDVSAGNLQSRLITYRTYSNDEYRDISGYLLRNNFHVTEQYDFGEDKHSVYSNGNQEVRVKVIHTGLKNGKKFIAWELELGR